MIEGNKIVADFLRNKHQAAIQLICTEEWFDKYSHTNELNCELSIVSQREMKQITVFKTVPQVILIAQRNLNALKEIIKPKFKAVFLDDVQDPGNVGSIIRTACWFGYDAVIRSIGSSDFYNSKVVQSSMGGFINLNLITASIDEIKDTFPSISLVGTSLDHSESYEHFSPADQFAIVIGHEGRGMTSTTKNLVDHNIHIPGSGNIESLNAGVAFAIVASKFDLKN